MKRTALSEGLLWKHWLQLEKKQAGKVVVIDAALDESWTVRMLAEATIPFAKQLSRFKAGERIAFRLPNGPEWMALFLALQKHGLAAIPLDGGMPTEGCLETAKRLGAREVYLDEKFHSLGKPTIGDKKICCIKVTSGTGAVPKAIECRAEHLLADGLHVVRTMSIRPNDRNLAVIPLGHSYGLGNLVMPLIQLGTAMVTAGAYVPRQLVEWIERYSATVFPAVPALLRVLAGLPEGEGKIASLRIVISAGAMLNPTVAQAFHQRFGLKIHNFYGSSETGAICYDKTGGASLTGRSVGKPFAGVSVTVKAGRITVASPAVATRSKRWQMNDLGEWNKRGELVLLGRAGQDANIGGKKVHPLEIERMLRALVDVTDAVVWMQQRDGRDFLVAGVETKQSREEIERALAARLPAWKLPKAYVIKGEFPRNQRGKLDLAALKSQA